MWDSGYRDMWALGYQALDHRDTWTPSNTNKEQYIPETLDIPHPDKPLNHVCEAWPKQFVGWHIGHPSDWRGWEQMYVCHTMGIDQIPFILSHKPSPIVAQVVAPNHRDYFGCSFRRIIPDLKAPSLCPLAPEYTHNRSAYTTTDWLGIRTDQVAHIYRDYMDRFAVQKTPVVPWDGRGVSRQKTHISKTVPSRSLWDSNPSTRTHRRFWRHPHMLSICSKAPEAGTMPTHGIVRLRADGVLFPNLLFSYQAVSVYRCQS